MDQVGVGSAFTSRPAGRWPGRPLLTWRLREILRREFDAADAWIVHANRRLERLFRLLFCNQCRAR